jgi:hypothetical protein
MAADRPTIVLVHGAWADATGFDAQIRALRDRGYAGIPSSGSPTRFAISLATRPTWPSSCGA